jgi:hypothetical protein
MYTQEETRSADDDFRVPGIFGGTKNVDACNRSGAVGIGKMRLWRAGRDYKKLGADGVLGSPVYGDGNFDMGGGSIGGGGGFGTSALRRAASIDVMMPLRASSSAMPTTGILGHTDYYWDTHERETSPAEGPVLELLCPAPAAVHTSDGNIHEKNGKNGRNGRSNANDETGPCSRGSRRHGHSHNAPTAAGGMAGSDADDEGDSDSEGEDGACGGGGSISGGEWQTIEGGVLLLWVMSAAWGASDAHVVPGASFGDGLLHLLVVRKASRYQLARILLALESGSHIDHPCVEVFKCKAVRLEPMMGSRKSGGIISVDGEAVPPQPVQMEVHQGLARVFCNR